MRLCHPSFVSCLKIPAGLVCFQSKIFFFLFLFLKIRRYWSKGLPKNITCSMSIPLFFASSQMILERKVLALLISEENFVIFKSASVSNKKTGMRSTKSFNKLGKIFIGFTRWASTLNATQLSIKEKVWFIGASPQ